jgi:hypothetical protein
MQSAAARSLAPAARALEESALRVAFLGERAWLDLCAPPAPAAGLLPACFELWPDADNGSALELLGAFAPHVSVVIGPWLLREQELRELPGCTLGVLHGAAAGEQAAAPLAAFDRLVSFDPGLTGTEVGGAALWRAVPPPVSDLYYEPARPLHRAPLALSIGEWTPHREAMLVDAKHRFDLLEVLSGVGGEELAELLREYDVGVHVAREHGGGFGPQVGLHLAAGQLLLSEPLAPAHGLEPEIDYLQVRSEEDIGWVLERLARFPEMHAGVRVRGRLKAERYRASRLFARIAHDLLADVAAFGRGSAVA